MRKCLDIRFYFFFNIKITILHQFYTQEKKNTNHIINLIPYYYLSIQENHISIHPSHYLPASIHVAVNYYKRYCYIIKAIKFITKLRSSIKPTSYLEIEISSKFDEASSIAFSQSVSKHIISDIFGKTSFKFRSRCKLQIAVIVKIVYIL